MKNKFALAFTRYMMVLASLSLTIPPVFSQNKLDLSIPADPQVRTGKLNNGLTYYIRQNRKPEKRIEMRLVVKAGSVLEDDDQRGLAHFIEHMAFNGTKNFAKNDLISYLQSAGVQFGPEINAYTSFDETVYMLTLPADSLHVVEKGFQIMEDWAHNLAFDPVEIDKERGIIVEEWRMGQGPNQRMQEKLFPVLLKDSKFANRLPIGKKEIIEGAPYETLKKFYYDWYRPDLMAFIVVGDLEPDYMESMVRQYFDRLTMPKKPRKREVFDVPFQKGTAVALATDHEMPYTIVQIAIKTDPPPQKLNRDYYNNVKVQLVTSMLNQRLSELKEQANPPLLMSAVQYGSLGVSEKNAMQLLGIVPETGIERGVETLVTESERALQHGFTQGELDRAKKQFLSVYEMAYNEREKTESESFTSEYTRNFLNGECFPGITYEYELVKEYLPGIAIEEVNAVAAKFLLRDNRAVLIMAPSKEGLVLPAESQILAVIDNIEKSNIEAYVDKTAGVQLMKEIPAKGRILLTRKNEAFGTLEMSLSNGAKVILKPTDFKNDEVLFKASSPGGYSLCDLNDHESAVYAADIVSACGLADYSPSALKKLLAGKVASVSPYIDAYFEGMNGSAKPADVESMLQLVHLYFTQPRKDSMLYASFISQYKGVVSNLLADPENYFQDQFERAKSQNHPLGNYVPSLQDIEKIKLDRAFEIYCERFADASGFTFFIVGSFKPDSIKPLIETYLASLPATRKQETYKDMGIRAPENKTEVPVYKGNDPKSIVAVYSEANAPWDPLQSHLFSSLGQLLDIKYNEKLREEMSGIYGMGVSLEMVKIPYNHVGLTIFIPCSPENTDLLTTAALKEIAKIQQQGVAPEDLVKVKEAQRRTLENNLKENSYWIGQLVNVSRLNDPGQITEISNRIESITSEKLQEVARKLDLSNYLRVVLYPEKK